MYNYDFVSMEPTSNTPSFSELLNDWKGIQSIIINTIISFHVLIVQLKIIDKPA